MSLIIANEISAMVKLSQLPSSQLLEVPEQSSNLSVEWQGSGPKAKAEVIELRNK